MKKLILFALALGLLASCEKKEPTLDRTDFVVITDVIPDAILEIRYYSTYNFV